MFGRILLFVGLISILIAVPFGLHQLERPLNLPIDWELEAANLQEDPVAFVTNSGMRLWSTTEASLTGLHQAWNQFNTQLPVLQQALQVLEKIPFTGIAINPQSPAEGGVPNSLLPQVKIPSSFQVAVPNDAKQIDSHIQALQQQIQYLEAQKQALLKSQKE